MYVRMILLQITTWQYWHSLYALQFKESATWFVLFERANKYEMRHSLFWFISYSPSQRNCLQAALLILHMNKMWKHKKIQKPFFVVILIKACVFLSTLSIFIQFSPFVWYHDQTSSIYLIRSDCGKDWQSPLILYFSPHHTLTLSLQKVSQNLPKTMARAFRSQRSNKFCLFIIIFIIIIILTFLLSSLSFLACRESLKSQK